MTTIAQQLRELHDLTPAELAGRYEDLFGKPPRVRNKAWLRRQVAWKIQERHYGGLSPRAKARLDELISQIDLPLARPEPKRQPRRSPEQRELIVGTTITRQWHDQEIRVQVREDGFEWEGRPYRSLSAIARAVTGANWSGPLFFRLKARRTSR